MFIVREDSRLSRPAAAGKVIKAQDFWAFKEAERALKDAFEAKQEIIEAAKGAYQAEKERGYAEGSESARRDQSGNMLEIMSQTVEYFGRIEGEMVDLVLEAVQKVVNDFDDRQRISTVVKNCLDLVRSQKHLSIHVHPSQVEFLRGQIGPLQAIYPSIAQIEVHPDARLAADACVVETEIGIVEASLAGQVEVLRETLASVFDVHLPESERSLPAASSTHADADDSAVSDDPRDEEGGADHEDAEDFEDSDTADEDEDDEEDDEDHEDADGDGDDEVEKSGAR
ncbi:MAG: HrpE/YscL family type III secretion apparatus protein [Pseudomonadota bacterium]